MDLKLKEKIILVTGGSKGIGHAISHVLAADGAIPFIVSRDEKSILQTKEEIEKKGGKCAFAIAELTDPEQCKRAVEKAISLYGTLHGLVNNAGIRHRKKFLDIKKNDLENVFQTNFFSIFQLMQLFSKNLIKKKLPGSIVNIYSGTFVATDGCT